MSDEEPAAPAGEEVAQHSWTSTVVLAKVDHGGGSYADLTPAQLGLLGDGFVGVDMASLAPEEPEVGEDGEPVPFTLENAIAALRAKIPEDAAAGVEAKKVKAEEEAAAAAEAAEAAAAEDGGDDAPAPAEEAAEEAEDGVEVVPEEPPPPPPDVTYVLQGFSDTAAAAEDLLSSDMPIDTIVALSLPASLMAAPEPEEGDEAAEPPPEPAAPVDGLLEHLQGFIAETLEPASVRNGIAWTAVAVEEPEPEPEAEDEPEAEAEAEPAPDGDGDGDDAAEPPPEPTEEELAEAAAAKAAAAKEALVAQLVGELSGVLAVAMVNRDAYAEYRQSVTVVLVPAAAVVPAGDLTLYNRLLDTFEGEAGVKEGHVVDALIRQMVASFVDSNDEDALKNEDQGELAQVVAENALDGAVELEQTVSSALQAAMTGFGQPQLADDPSLRVGRQNWLASAQENVKKGVKKLEIMSDQLPVPGKGRSCMPSEPPKSEGDRLAQAASLYHFVDLRPEQVDRALLRDEFAQVIMDRESQLEERPPTPAGRVRQSDMLKTRWDKHLSSRTYFETLAAPDMTAAYTHAVTSASPATEVYTTYCDREDTLLVTLHTPSPPDTRISEEVAAEVAIPCLPSREAFDQGYRPDMVYAVAPSKTTVSATQQYMYPSDSGVMMARKADKVELKAYVGGHTLSCVDSTMTAALRDGFVLVSDPESLTLTDPSGRSVSLNTSGVVVTHRGSASAEAKASETTALEASETKVVTVGSSGTVVKTYDGGNQEILFANGDVSSFNSSQGFWVDTNAIGARLGRSEGATDFYVRPLNCVSNTDYITGTEHIQREDLVHTSKYTDGTRVVTHPGAIKMTQQDSGVLTVDLIDYGVTVVSSGGGVTVNTPSGATLEVANGTICGALPSGDSVSIAGGVANFNPATAESQYVFDLNASSVQATDPRGSTFTVSSEGECDSLIVPESEAESAAAGSSTAEEPVAEEEPAIISSSATEDDVPPHHLRSDVTNESENFMRGEEIEGEVKALDEEEEEEESEEEEEEGDSDEDEEEGDKEFSDQKCPEKMPDLTEHCTIMARVLKADPSIYHNNKTSATALGVPFARCIKTGMDHQGPESIVGVVAGDEECYTKFAALFDPIIDMRHNGFAPADSHTTELNPEKLSGKPVDPDDKYILSTRIRTARSIRGLRLAPAISQAERRKVEQIMANALIQLEGELAGDYSPLAGSESYPEKLGGMSAEEEDQLRADRHLFMESDNPVTISGGIGRDWPDARGIFVNDAKNFLVWVNEEDHTRIISMELGSDINAVFTRYCQAISQVQSNLQQDGYEFQHSDRLGYVLTCPSQLGTGMRASFMIKIPLFAEREDFREVCRNMQLDVRGDGVDGVYDISNADRLGRSEVQLVNCLKDGAIKIIAIEQALEAGESVDEMIVEIAAIAAAGEVYGDEGGPPPPPKDVSSHAPRLFVVRPDGSGFEWAIQEEIEYALARGERTEETISAPEPNSVVCSVGGRMVTMHPSLTEEEVEKLQDGLARFEQWELGEGDAGELLPPKEPEPEPEPEREPTPEPPPKPEPEP